MKRALVIICLLTSVNTAFGQIKGKILGKWQAEQAEITSMSLDSYEFLNNGWFIFKPNEYNGLNRIISINGKYKIKGDTLFMTPIFTKEIVGGYLIRSESTTLSDTWEIIGGQEKQIVTIKKIKQSAAIKTNQDNRSFTLDERKFFKVDL